MMLLRTFSHDGCDFEIQAHLNDEMWEIVTFCDGNRMSEVVTVPAENQSDAKAIGIDLLEQSAIALEAGLRSTTVEIKPMHRP